MTAWPLVIQGVHEGQWVTILVTLSRARHGIPLSRHVGTASDGRPVDSPHGKRNTAPQSRVNTQ